MTHPWHQPKPRPKSIAAWPILAAVALGLWSPAHAADTSTPPQAGAAVLSVTFKGLKTLSGAILASLTASPAAYDGKAPPAGQATAAVTGETVTITFSGLKPGLYAIKAFHDLNGDGQLNTNPFGMPTEPYAFSNNARGMMGPAPWSAAAFEVKAGPNGQTIDID